MLQRSLKRLALAALLCVPAASAWPAQEVLLVLGDSLSAGYGVAQGSGWVDLLPARLRQAGHRAQVVNASVSGLTAADGALEVDALLRTHRPQAVILELGANDGLRGTPPAQLKASLETLVQACQRAHARTLLVGMRLPPNYGADYTRHFAETFSEVARAQRVPLVAFLFEGFAQRRELFQADGLHPIAAAQPLMLELVWKSLQPLLKRVARP